MTAQQLALRHPDRVERLVLVGTYARPDAKRRLLLEKWREMAKHELGAGIMVRERLLWTLRDETLEQTDLVDAMASSFPGGGIPIDADLFMRQCDACLGHDTVDRLREIPALDLRRVRSPRPAHAPQAPPRDRGRDPERPPDDAQLRRPPRDGRVRPAVERGRAPLPGRGMSVLPVRAAVLNEAVLHFLGEE